jgi:hypothetical protein
MRIELTRTFLACASAIVLSATAAAAQMPSPPASPLPPPTVPPSPSVAPTVASRTASPSAQADKAAELATKAAKQVLLESRHGSNMNGTVALYQIGRTRTRVVVRIPQGGNYALSLYPGSDCADNIEQVRSAIALAPINTAAANAPESQTIVELPIEKLQSDNYVVDVRNATNRQALAQACARITR